MPCLMADGSEGGAPEYLAQSDRNCPTPVQRGPPGSTAPPPLSCALAPPPAAAPGAGARPP
eukprot:974191-Prorocentrum_minimum.AAC.1